MLLNCGIGEETLESPLDSKEIKPVNPKGNQLWIFIGRTDVEAEAPILWPPDVKNWLTGKDSDAEKDWKQKQKETTEDEMVGWHHWLDGHEFEQAPGVGDGQGSLACCSPWGHKELDTTDRLNWTELSKRNKLITNTCSILGKPLKHNVEQKEPDLRINAMWFHLHSILKKQAKLKMVLRNAYVGGKTKEKQRCDSHNRVVKLGNWGCDWEELCRGLLGCWQHSVASVQLIELIKLWVYIFVHFYIMHTLFHNQKKKRVCRFEKELGMSLVIQWLRLCTPNAGDLGCIPGQGTRSCMPQLKSPRAATKTRLSKKKNQKPKGNF